MKGITVCRAWRDYSIFSKWAKENGYRPGLSIDRIDNDKGYTPRNCRWADHFIQNNNKSNVSRHSYYGEIMSYAQAGRKYGIEQSVIRRRIKTGYTPEQAIVKGRFKQRAYTRRKIK